MARLKENWRQLIMWIVVIALFNLLVDRVGDTNFWALLLLNFVVVDIFAIWFLSEFWTA